MRPTSLLLLSSACAATVTFSKAVERLSVTRSEPPLSAQDTIVALSIREAVLHGIPDFELRRHVIVQRVAGVVSSHALPQIDSVAFHLLDTLQIGELADKAGNFTYLRPSPPSIDGDSAMVGVASAYGLDRSPHRHGGMVGGGGCSWRTVRRSGAWVVDTLLGCYII